MSNQLTENTFEISLEAKVRHGKLWKLAKRFGSISALAEEVGVHPTTLSTWVNLKTTPLHKRRDGSRSLTKKTLKVVLKLCELGECKPVDLFPDWMADFKLLTNKFEVSKPVTEEELLVLGRQLEQPSPLQIAMEEEAQQKISKALKLAMKRLDMRSQEVLKLRWGLDDGVNRTLDESARIFRVTRERIRQIECKAMRKLRSDHSLMREVV